MELRGDLRQGGKVCFPRKREKLVLVLKLSVGDVSGERPADLLNNSDLVRAVKAENLLGEIRGTHWAPLDRRSACRSAHRRPKVTERWFHCRTPNGEGPVWSPQCTVSPAAWCSG